MKWKKGDIVDFKVYCGISDSDYYTQVGRIVVLPDEDKEIYDADVIVIGGDVESEIGDIYTLSKRELLPHTYQPKPKPQEPFWVCETREDMHNLIEDVMDYYKRFHDHCSEQVLVSNCLESLFAKSEER